MPFINTLTLSRVTRLLPPLLHGARETQFAKNVRCSVRTIRVGWVWGAEGFLSSLACTIKCRRGEEKKDCGISLSFLSDTTAARRKRGRMWCKGKEEGSHLFDKWGPHSKLRRRGRGKNIFFSFLLFLYFCMSVGRSVGFCLQYTQGGPGHISSRSIWQDRVSAVAAVPNSWKATEAFSIFINGDFGQNSILFSSSGSGGQGWQQERIKPPFKGFIFHAAPSLPSPTSICSNMLRTSRLRNMSPPPPPPPQFTARTEREREQRRMRFSSIFRCLAIGDFNAS